MKCEYIGYIRFISSGIFSGYTVILHKIPGKFTHLRTDKFRFYYLYLVGIIKQLLIQLKIHPYAIFEKYILLVYFQFLLRFMQG